MMVKTVLEVHGMSCGMCEAHINDTIRRAFSVRSVKSSRKKEQTEIVSDQPLDEAALRAAITATGYEVGSISAEPCEKKGLFR